MPASSYLVTDELTVLLGLIAASTFLLRSLYKPQPLVHPILLGRQSDASRVRNPGESATYRNYGTGMMGRFPLRPSKEVYALPDLLKAEFDSPRTLWSTKITNPELKTRVSALGTGLIRTAGLSKESNVLLLLNDGIEFLLTDLALATHGIPSFTLSSLSLLSQVLESHPPDAIITHASFLPHLLELIYDSAEHEHHSIIVVGQPSGDLGLEKMKGHVNILSWSHLESEGGKIDQVQSAIPDPSTVFTVSFYVSPSGRLESTHLTHENITAGVAATRTLLPLSNAISPLDTIVSAHSMSTAFGRTVAYTALYEGTGFATMPSTALIPSNEKVSTPVLDLDDLMAASTKLPIPSPTILFIKPKHLSSLVSAILQQASGSMWYPIARRHKLAGMVEGFVSKDGLWDRAVFDAARSAVIGDGAGSVRGVIVGDTESLAADALAPARMALSVPLVHTHVHPVVAGPVFATHPLDLQAFPVESANAYGVRAPVGPPSINIDAKLHGVVDTAIEAGADPEGMLYVRGPSVGKVEVVGEEGAVQEEDGWIATGERASVMTNGCFKVVSSL